tara:strand:+ start:471 stop:896 length:426 start_codon:yes stop_codon:yes gene_type:complete
MGKRSVDQKIKSIRSVIGMEDGSPSRRYLLKKEMEEVVHFITGEQKTCKDYSQYFYENLKDFGFSSQKTIDSHPNNNNLNVIIKNINKKRSDNVKQSEDVQLKLPFADSDMNISSTLVDKIGSQSIERIEVSEKSVNIFFK